MANTNNPFGFRWHGTAGDGVTPSSGIIVAKVASGNTTTFGEGDPLSQVSATGYVTAFTAGTSGYNLIGVFKSCEYYSTSQGRKIYKNYWPGSDATGDVTVHLYSCIGAVNPRFLVQSSGVAAHTLSSVGLNIDITSASSTAGTVTGGFYRSACTVGLLASASTTTSLPFRIVQLYSDIAAPGSPGADTASAYNWLLVQPNNYAVQGV